MSAANEEKRIRLRGFARAWDEYVYGHALSTNSFRKTAEVLGLEIETVRAVMVDCEARRERQKQKELA